MGFFGSRKAAGKIGSLVRLFAKKKKAKIAFYLCEPKYC
jgi:hypothetical protein